MIEHVVFMTLCNPLSPKYIVWFYMVLCCFYNAVLSPRLFLGPLKFPLTRARCRGSFCIATSTMTSEGGGVGLVHGSWFMVHGSWFMAQGWASILFL